MGISFYRDIIIWIQEELSKRPPTATGRQEMGLYFKYIKSQEKVTIKHPNH